MSPVLGHLAQEGSRLPLPRHGLGSVSRVVQELSLRLARRYPLTVYSTRRAGDAVEEEAGGVHHVRLPAGTERAVLGEYYRWRNRIGRHLGLRERQFAGSPGYFYSYIRRVARRAAQDGAQLVHLHDVSQFVPPLRAALPQTALVLQMHCEWLVELPPARVAQRLAHVDLVLGVSEHIVQQIQRALPALAPRCRVLPNGVDLDAFPPRRTVMEAHGAELAALRAGLGLRGPVILYVGRLASEKGVHVLLQAFTRLRAQWPNASCLVVGPNWGPIRKVRPPSNDAAAAQIAWLDRDYMGHLRALARPHGERVVFVGAVSNADLPLYHALADVLVAPSLREAFGIPPVEAAASGLPVVASATGGLRDTIVPGRTGLLVPPGDDAALADALAAILGNPEAALALGAAARAHVASSFTWDRAAERLAGYYEDLFAARARARRASADSVPSSIAASSVTSSNASSASTSA
jgi:glycosyltransferase involved in cell wall biosynthesis